MFIGFHHQHLESLNTTSKEILMGIMALTIGRIRKDLPLGECTRMERVDQGILLVKIRITDFINIDHLQTQEALSTNIILISLTKHIHQEDRMVTGICPDTQKVYITQSIGGIIILSTCEEGLFLMITEVEEAEEEENHLRGQQKSFLDLKERSMKMS